MLNNLPIKYKAHRVCAFSNDLRLIKNWIPLNVFQSMRRSGIELLTYKESYWSHIRKLLSQFHIISNTMQSEHLHRIYEVSPQAYLRYCESSRVFIGV